MATDAVTSAYYYDNYYEHIVCIVSPAALLYYDYILTLNSELMRFWSPLQCNWGTVVFLLNRYTAIFGHIPIVAELFIPSTKGKQCSTLTTYHSYLAITIQVIAGVVMILRVHALWGRSRSILTIMLVFGVIVLALGVWFLLSSRHTILNTPIPGIIGCMTTEPSDQVWHVGAAWSCAFLFDAMIFSLTVYKTLQIGRTSRRTIVYILLRDGSMYFAIMSTMMLINVLVLLLGGPFSRRMMTTYTNIVASTCSARLMLNIRDPKIQLSSPPATLDTSQSSRLFVSTIVDIDPTSIDETRQQDDIELVAQNV